MTPAFVEAAVRHIVDTYGCREDIAREHVQRVVDSGATTSEFAYQRAAIAFFAGVRWADTSQVPAERPSITDIQRALGRLNDAICAFARAGLGTYTVVVVLHDLTQPVQVSLDGKPVDVDAARALDVAMMERAAVGADADAWRAG